MKTSVLVSAVIICDKVFKNAQKVPMQGPESGQWCRGPKCWPLVHHHMFKIRDQYITLTIKNSER